MDSYFSNFIINILLMAFAIFSILELIYDKSVKRPFYRKISKRGWLLILIAFLTIAFNLYKDWQADIKQKDSDKAKAESDSLLQKSQQEILLLQISTKDTIIKKVDSAYVNSIKASNEALARYNLIITDSLHSVVSKLKLDADKPQLIVAPLEAGKQPAYLTNEEEMNKFNIQFISKGGTSYHIQLNCYFIKDSNNGNYSIIDALQISFGETLLTEDVLRTKQIQILPELLEQSEVLIFLTGSFSKDPQGKIIIPFNEAFKFNFKENKFINSWEMEYNTLKEQLNIK